MDGAVPDYVACGPAKPIMLTAGYGWLAFGIQFDEGEPLGLGDVGECTKIGLEPCARDSEFGDVINL